MVNTSEILIKIQDTDWNSIGEFQAEKGKTLSQMAEAHQIDIPIACGAWACFVCAVKVLKWRELMNQSMISNPLVDLEEDQFLTCIGWIKNEYFDDGNSHEIILQKIN